MHTRVIAAGRRGFINFFENYSNVALTVILIPVNAMAHIFFYHLLSMAAYNHFLQDTEETYFVITGSENVFLGFFFCLFALKYGN